MLWWPDETVDDHPRPRLPLWRQYHYPESARELIVSPDGTVTDAGTLYTFEMLRGVAVRHMQVMDSQSHTALSLADAGYELRPI